MTDQHLTIKESSILIVDDTPDNLRLLSAILTKEGYKVRKALNGNRALMTVQKSPPDLILLDVMMPEIDGYEVCKKLKSLENTRSIPVIFISALDNVSDKIKAFEAGGVDYISKPFQEIEVLARVKTHLILQKQQQQLKQQKNKLENQNEQLYEEIIQRKNVELRLRLAQQKSEILWNKNLLPKLLYSQLVQKQMLTPQLFKSVTILCIDIVNIEELSKEIEPIELVDYFDQLLVKIESLCKAYGFDDVKIIGDAYMVVAGVPMPRYDHGEAIAQMALEMQATIAAFKLKSDRLFQMRIGIHTGPVMAGLVGDKKFIYDLWGATVDLAIAMESTAKPGKIQVTQAIYNHLKDRYIFEKRGSIPIKGQDDIITYWLLGKK